MDNHTTLPLKHAVAGIVQDYRRRYSPSDRPLPLRAFAQALSEVVAPFGGKVSHQTIKNWEDGRHLPATFLLTQIAFHAGRDWRGEFAQDLLSILQPGRYQPATTTGAARRKALHPG